MVNKTQEPICIKCYDQLIFLKAKKKNKKKKQKKKQKTNNLYIVKFKKVRMNNRVSRLAVRTICAVPCENAFSDIC